MTPWTTRLDIVWQYWQAGGWLMVPLALIMFGIWERYLRLRRELGEALAGQACLAAVEERLHADAPVRDPAMLTGLCPWLAEQPGALARVLRHLFARVGAGLAFREAYDQCREAELAPYTHAFYVLGALVTAAPLVGLLGTVLGMIATFDAVTGGGSGTGSLVAGGISQALITTQVGLIAALPGAFGLAHLFRLYQQLRHDLDRCESHLYLLLETPIGAHR